MQGLHLTADLMGCAAAQPIMHDARALAALCRHAVGRSGLESVGEAFHGFAPGGAGVTGVLLLAESHLAIHTWPELGAVTIDVYVCNLGADNSARARALMHRLIDAFAPANVERHELRRGAALAPQAAATRSPAPVPSVNASSKTE